MVGSSVGLGGAVVVLVQGFWVCEVCIWVCWILGLMLCSGDGVVLILDLMFFLELVFGVTLWFGEFWCLVFGLVCRFVDCYCVSGVVRWLLLVAVGGLACWLIVLLVCLGLWVCWHLLLYEYGCWLVYFRLCWV